jgi:hypothetical protein
MELPNSIASKREVLPIFKYHLQKCCISRRVGATCCASDEAGQDIRALDDTGLSQSRQSLRSDIVGSMPPPLELVNFGDEPKKLMTWSIGLEAR